MNNLELYKDKQVALSNALIQAKKKTSLLESKIELLAIYKLKDESKIIEKKDIEGKKYSVHMVELYPSEIRRLTEKKGGSIYSQMATAAVELKRKVFIYADPANDEFKMDTLYGEVIYRDGTMRVEFNPQTEFLFSDLTDNFTKLDLGICFNFRTSAGFMLYKLLRTYMYTLPEIDLELMQEEQQSIVKKFSLAELRLHLGFVDIDQPEIKKEGMKAHPSAEKMVELQDYRPSRNSYRRWSDLYNRCIKPGIDEINGMPSDIFISKIDTVKGAHGKIEEVIFYFQKNKNFYGPRKPKKAKEKFTPEQIDDFVDELRPILKDVEFKTKDLKLIAQAAEYDYDKIVSAYKIMMKSKNVENAVGFMLSAIRDGYKEPVTVKSSKGFNDFEQREYDYAELERDALYNVG